jgi:nucleoid-associated protein YgaU
LLLALGAAGVTLAVVLGIIGLPAVNACSADPRGVVSCLRDMAERKFDLPGRSPRQLAEATPPDLAAPPATVVDRAESPTASGGPLEAPSMVSPETPPESAPAPEPAATSTVMIEAAPAPAPDGLPPTDAEPFIPQPPALAAVPEVATPPAAEPRAAEPQLSSVDDTALTWTAPPPAEDGPEQAEQTWARDVQGDVPTAAAAPSAEPAKAESVKAPEPDLPPVAADPVAPQDSALPSAPLVLANAEPATAQPPAPAIAAPVILAPTIDAIELDGGSSYVSGSGPAGALMRLYADGQLIGESPVEEGRWLVEGSNLLDTPRRELRVEAIEPDTGKLLGVAAITVEIELPDGGAPPDERPEQPPDLGSGVAPAPLPDPHATSPAPQLAPIQPSIADPSDNSAVAANQSAIPPMPLAEPADQPVFGDDPGGTEPELLRKPELAAVAPEPLPPLASVLPRGESASVQILGPSSLQPTTLPPAENDDDGASTLTLPAPQEPALMARFTSTVARPGQPVTILRLLPFGDPDEGRYNVGKAIIRRGDTLWSIARRYYGHGIHYRTIFHANRELIRRPSRIFPGQIFDLPLVTDD